MTTALRLGQSETATVTFDLESLMETRLLIFATSGGGKTGAIYQLCEQSVPHVQVIIMDPEGEFAPLRAKYPFVLAGPDGETPATVKTAGLLAHTLLELGASAICDLYELPPHERQEYVRDFLRAMVDAPKSLWRPVIVVLDEAHIFAPEKGQGESVALEAVIDMASRGRKRGFCIVPATQRLAMLSKTVAANCQNVLVGRTSQIDQVRAAETLQISGKAAREEFWKIVSRARTGEFFAHGMAFHTDVPTRFQVDRAETLPEKKDRMSLQAPPSPAGITALLPKLADLPQEADKRAKTVEDLQKDLREARAEIARLTAEGGQGDAMGLADDIQKMEAELEELRPLRVKLEDLQTRLFGFGSALAQVGSAVSVAQDRLNELIGGATPAGDEVLLPALPAGRAASITPRDTFVPTAAPVVPHDGVNGPQQRILNAMATLHAIRNAKVTLEWIACTAGTTPRARGFEENMRQLKSKGLVDGIRLTDAGRAIASADTTPATFAHVLPRLGTVLSTPQLDILRALKVSQRSPASLAEILGTTDRARGFEENVRQLKKRELIVMRGGKYQLVEWLEVLR